MQQNSESDTLQKRSFHEVDPQDQERNSQEDHPEKKFINNDQVKVETSNTNNDESSLRICIQGISDFLKDYEIYKELNKKFDPPLKMVSIMKEPRKPFCFIQFETVQDIERINAVADLKIKNRTVRIKSCKASGKQMRSFKPINIIESKINERETANTGFATKSLT